MWQVVCYENWWVDISWWRHQMEAFSALLALCAGNSPVTGEFPSQKGQLCGLRCFFDVGPHKLLNRQSNDRWFETTWRSCDVIVMYYLFPFRQSPYAFWNVEWHKIDMFDDITHSRCLSGLRDHACSMLYRAEGLRIGLSPCWFDCDFRVIAIGWPDNGLKL